MHVYTISVHVYTISEVCKVESFFLFLVEWKVGRAHLIYVCAQLVGLAHGHVHAYVT